MFSAARSPASLAKQRWTVGFGISDQVERPGRRRLVLSRKLYSATGRRGPYTRAVGLDRTAQMELAYRHLQRAGSQGAPMRELMDVLPGLDPNQVFSLLDALRRAGRARAEGERRAARWFGNDG